MYDLTETSTARYRKGLLDEALEQEMQEVWYFLLVYTKRRAGTEICFSNIMLTIFHTFLGTVLSYWTTIYEATLHSTYVHMVLKYLKGKLYQALSLYTRLFWRIYLRPVVRD